MIGVDELLLDRRQLFGKRPALFLETLLLPGSSAIPDLADLDPQTSRICVTASWGTHPEARTIVDLVPDCGPLGGLHAALTEARADAVFVVACDMPYITGRFVTYLLSLANDVEIVVPRTERGYHPLCAVYARTCLKMVARRLAERRLKLADLFADARTRVVTGEDIDTFGDRHRLLANVNTPEEYAGLEALHSHK